jgi:phosphoribosylaminoimidazolecarboxamide formyltransferase/IMP cyclohydrolase
MERKIERALVSVFDKRGLVDLCRDLAARGVEILSTGGTAAALLQAGVRVKQVSEHTGFPEILGGRVKTLHPAIHGGILARRSEAEHMRQIAERGFGPIDLVVVNLYPFEQTVAGRTREVDAVVEMIDIGGPSMIRSAAKNFADVAVVTDPADYPAVREEIAASGEVSPATRLRLAAKAFAHTAHYDSRIAAYVAELRAAPEGGGRPELGIRPGGFPDVLVLGLRKAADLRYGENPHQAGALYADPGETRPGGSAPSGAVTARQLQGKELSFNNILDLDAAWAAAAEFEGPACVIVKHTTPCGASEAASPIQAYLEARECDPVSAFGGIVAFNRPLDGATAKEMSALFLEAVIAPSYAPEALEALKGRKNLRLMEAGEPPRRAGGWDLKRVTGGVLVQDRDRADEDPATFKVVTRRAPTAEETRSLLFAWRIARHVKSNAIVYAKGTRTVGIGAGQMSRVDSARIGAQKAREDLRGSALASDAFFPFRDGVEEAARAGVTAVIQPGGSMRDEEVVAAADEHGLAMLFTGRRHFRH